MPNSGAFQATLSFDRKQSARPPRAPDYAYLESNLYDGVGGGIIWTGRSETAMKPDDVYGQIPGVVELLVNELIQTKK